jgi:serine/threonine protein phosphatase PrpC
VNVEAAAGVALTVRARAASHRGQVRTRNEDAVAVAGWMPVGHVAGAFQLAATAASPFLAIVADGAGGHPGGDVASRLTVRHLSERAQLLVSPDALADAIRGAHASLHSHAHEHPELAGFGTTVAAVAITPESVIAGNVGDTRIYELIDGEPVQLSTDDSPERPDFISDERTSNTLTQMLGGRPGSSVAPHVSRYEAERGLEFLICSDGLAACVPDPLLGNAIRAAAEHENLAESLLHRALAAGAPDNVSIVHLHTEPATQGALR